MAGFIPAARAGCRSLVQSGSHRVPTLIFLTRSYNLFVYKDCTLMHAYCCVRQVFFCGGSARVKMIRMTTSVSQRGVSILGLVQRVQYKYISRTGCRHVAGSFHAYGAI